MTLDEATRVASNIHASRSADSRALEPQAQNTGECAKGETRLGGTQPGWLCETEIDLFEWLSSYCLLVVKPSHAASESDRCNDDDCASEQDTHFSPPIV